MSFLDELRESIEFQIAEHHAEIATLEAARAALAETESAAVLTPPPAPARTRQRRRAGSRAATEVLAADKLEAMLREADGGLSAVTISKRSHAGYGQVLGLLRTLEQAGRVRRSGSRRTSLWRLVSDEDLVAERAAELERLTASQPPD